MTSAFVRIRYTAECGPCLRFNNMQTHFPMIDIVRIRLSATWTTGQLLTWTSPYDPPAEYYMYYMYWYVPMVSVINLLTTYHA